MINDKKVKKKFEFCYYSFFFKRNINKNQSRLTKPYVVVGRHTIERSIYL